MLHRLAGRFGVHDPPVPGSVQDFPEDVCLAELLAPGPMGGSVGEARRSCKGLARLGLG